MPDYDNTNKWSLFRNKDRKTDKHPEFSGNVNIDGTEYYLNGWVREGKSGKFFSGSVRPKDEPKPAGKPVWSIPDRDDEIPFAPEWR